MYHFRVKIISRGKGGGHSAAGAAAYRSGGRRSAAASAYRAGMKLHDPITGRTYDYSAKASIDADGFGILHSEIMLPHGAPMWLADRQALINAVEFSEKRKDAQLLREVELSLPRELSLEQQRDLVRAFVATTFVAQGMIADISLHDERASDGGRNPHAHILLTLRRVTSEGFGPKERAWNNPALVREWREAWADMANETLQALGFEARLDHRAHKDRGIDLEPDLYVGPKKTKKFGGVLADARAEQRSAAKVRNFHAIMDRPHVLLDAITREKATFTAIDVDRALTRATGYKPDDPEFTHIRAQVASSPELVSVASDQRGMQRFSTREMLNTELDMARAAQRLTSRGGKIRSCEAAATPPHLSAEQTAAYRHALESSDLALISGVAGAGKTTLLREVVAAYEAQGRRVRGAALAGIAAKKLGDEANIPAATLAALFRDWERKDYNGRPAARDPLRPGDVLILDEAGMVDSRAMRRVLMQAEAAGARVLLVGDAQQLQAIGAGAAFRALADTHGAARLDEVRRQSAPWMREATQDLARGDIAKALVDYRAHGAVREAPTTDAAMDRLIATWAAERADTPSQLILTYFTADVEALNAKAREVLRSQGVLGPDVRVQVQKQERDEDGALIQRAGYRTFATGDRILFLKNDKALDVQNGARGAVEAIDKAGHFAVRLDDGRTIRFDAADYGHVTQGYASTVHKAQGATVDRAYVLASNRFDAHLTYVALSRHTERATLFYGRDQFERPDVLARTLARQRPKDSTLDYLGAAGERARDGGHAQSGDTGAAARSSKAKLDTPHPQLKPTAAFVAAHSNAPTAPKAALDIVRANASKQRTRVQQRARERGLDES